MKRSMITQLVAALASGAFLLLSSPAIAQSLTNTSNTTLTVLNGTTLQVEGIENESNATLSNSGTINVNGNWTNNGNKQIDGIVAFTGSSSQTVNGETDFKRLVIDNSSSNAVAFQGFDKNRVLDTLHYRSGPVSVSTSISGGNRVSTFDYGPDGVLKYDGSSATNASDELPIKTTQKDYGPDQVIYATNGGGVTFTDKRIIKGTLYLKKGTINSNGNLIIHSDANGTGRIDGSGSGDIQGDLIVERYVPGSNQGYRYFSAPVGPDNTVTVSEFNDDVTIVGLGGGLNSNPFPNLWFYDETVQSVNHNVGWKTPNSLSDGLGHGKGWALNMPGQKTVDVKGDYQHNYGQRTFGNLTNSGIDQFDGFNLIGNPHPSAILFSELDRTNVDPTVSMWSSSGKYTGQYATYNATTQMSLNGGGDTIPSSQGFMVHVQPNKTGSVTTDNDDRVAPTDGGKTFYKQQQQNFTKLKLQARSGGYKDETIVFFNGSGTTPQFDSQWDAKKMKSNVANVPNMYTRFQAGNYAINGLPTPTSDLVVPLHYEVDNSGTHEIVVTDFEHFDPTAMVYLEDAKTGALQDLRQDSAYSFQMSASEDSSRFLLRFAPPLEVTTAAESCKGMDGEITLNQPGSTQWDYVVTNSQGDTVDTAQNFGGQKAVGQLDGDTYTLEVTNTYGYTVTKTVNVPDVQPVTASITNSPANSVNVGEPVTFSGTGQGASSYEWDFGDGATVTGAQQVTHQYSQAGVYKVVFSAANSKCSDSEVRGVEVKKTATGIEEDQGGSVTIFSTDDQLQVRFNEYGGGRGQIEVYNMLGQSLKRYDGVNANSGSKTIPMDEQPAGYYVVKVTSEQGHYTQKVFTGR